MTITEQGIRIDLPLLDYSKRRDTVLKECHMTLYKEYMMYKVVAEYEELNTDTEMWSPVKANHRYTRRRASLSGVDMFFSNREMLWSIDIEFLGVAEATGWLFTDPKQALAVYNQLHRYMVGIGE